MALVTIILTTLNSERYVARSIASCLGQSYGDFELIVVDGGSGDRTLEIIAGIDDPRIRVVHQPDNLGKLPGAINVGLGEARGDLITWTQDDSWYTPDAICFMVEALNARPEVGLVYADYWDVDAEGVLLRYQRVNPPEMIFEDDVVRQCFMMKRAVYEALGPQDTRYYPVHEPPWRIKVALEFGVAPLHTPLMYYTVGNDSLTTRFGRWTLQRMFPPILMQEGYLSAVEAKRWLARIHVDEAYEHFVLQGSYGNFWRCLMAGIAKDPRQLKNRGLLRMALVSLLPGRRVYRDRMREQWLSSDRALQATHAESASTDLRVGQLAPAPVMMPRQAP